MSNKLLLTTGKRGCFNECSFYFDIANEEENSISVSGNNPFNLDEEEMDIFELLTGARELRDSDVVPDDELMEQFAVFRKRNKSVDEAVRELAEGYMELIVSIARSFKCKGVPFLELIQEGYQGAQDAAERFDPERETRFSTYAGYWIKQRVRSAIVKKTCEIVYLQHVTEALHKVKWAVNEIRHESNIKSADAPTDEEIAALIGATTEKVKKLMNLPFAEKILDAPHRVDETDRGMHEVLADKKMPSPDYLVERAMFDGILKRLLNGLQPFEKLIIEKRFGLNGYCEGQTLEEIGDGKLSRERIRQIEARILSRLKLRLERIMDDNGIDRESLP